MIRDEINNYLPPTKSRFCMPGHKGRGTPLSHSLDVTEIPGLDNLNAPTGMIDAAQTRAAALYSAKSTYFLVGGSTLGVQTMLGAALQPGDSVIMARDCHISGINAAILFDLRPTFAYPGFDPDLGLSKPLTAADLDRAFAQAPDAKAILVTSPTYSGAVCDIPALAETCHHHNALLLCDEAHGAHLVFSEALPESAVRYADATVQSAHKTLPVALTSTALLHNNTLDNEKIRDFLNILQTSSPSSLLVESLERALDEISARRHELADLADQSDQIRAAVESTGRIRALSGPNVDSTRIHLTFAQDVCWNDFYQRDIVPEFVDSRDALFLTSIANTPDDFIKLRDAILDIALGMPRWSPKNALPPPKADFALPPRAAFYAPSIELPKEQAIGQISAQSVYQCPPCIPIICPGLKITADMLSYLPPYVKTVCA